MDAVTSLVGDRRQYPRKTGQICLRINGVVYHTAEWSYGGFLLEDSRNRLSTGALVQIDALISEDDYRLAGTPVPADIRARVVRADAEKGVTALSVLKMDDAGYRVLSALAAERDRITAIPAG